MEEKGVLVCRAEPALTSSLTVLHSEFLNSNAHSVYVLPCLLLVCSRRSSLNPAVPTSASVHPPIALATPAPIIPAVWANVRLELGTLATLREDLSRRVAEAKRCVVDAQSKLADKVNRMSCNHPPSASFACRSL